MPVPADPRLLLDVLLRGVHDAGATRLYLSALRAALMPFPAFARIRDLIACLEDNPPAAADLRVTLLKVRDVLNDQTDPDYPECRQQ